MGISDQAGFTIEGNWYKGNLHSHTTNSDGKLTPKQSVVLYKAHGYHFLCLSEHDLYTDYREQFNTTEFIVLPGLEASAVLLDEQNANPIKVHHMNGILGTSDMQAMCQERPFVHREYMGPQVSIGTWDGAHSAQVLADKLQKKGCIVTYNHPIWSRVKPEEFVHTNGLAAIEIFNYNTVNESGTGYDVTCWDEMLRARKNIHGFASDDNHNQGIFEDACGGYVVVKAQTLSHDDIIESLISGNYYSSAGPEIYDWGIKDGVVQVKCSFVERVNFICGGYINAGSTIISSSDQGINCAEFKLRGDEHYVRVECIDKDGKRAWTNALQIQCNS